MEANPLPPDQRLRVNHRADFDGGGGGGGVLKGHGGDGVTRGAGTRHLLLQIFG